MVRFLFRPGVVVKNPPNNRRAKYQNRIRIKEEASSETVHSIVTWEGSWPVGHLDPGLPFRHPGSIRKI